MPPKERLTELDFALKKVRKVEMVNDIIAWVDHPDKTLLGHSAIEAKGILQSVRPLSFLAQSEPTISLRRFQGFQIFFEIKIFVGSLMNLPFVTTDYMTNVPKKLRVHYERDTACSSSSSSFSTA